MTRTDDIVPLPSLLRRAAARRPDVLAVRDAGRSLTYRQLTDEVGRLAGHLRALGVRRGTRVACAVPRCVDAVVAQAAILDAGGVFVPIDPAYPAALLDRMLETCAVRAIVGYAEDLRRLAAPELGQVALDDPRVRAAAAAAEEPWPVIPARLEDEAYIIHTSGSTGTPKGVLVTHGAIARSTLARWSHYRASVRAFLLVSPMTFDSSLAGLWWTLSQGGTLELAPTDPVGTIAALRAALTGTGESAVGGMPISHTLLTPTLYRQVLDGLEPRDTVAADRTLTHVIVAGEACPAALVRTHHRLLPNVPLVNEYGPTEAAVWCSGGVLHPDEEVTIGTAIPGVELSVVDEAGTPCPDGTVGELAVAGEQLAVGYVGDATLTAARFIGHPDRPGTRVYRTGDRARRRPDGAFDLLGRVDDQVKVRGFRVDLAGVRQCLTEHPDITDAAVALRQRSGAETTAGPAVLTAYVVPAIDEAAAAASLRQTWEQVVDSVAATADEPAGDFDTSGWTSSYTGQPLPAQDMREWVEWTVALLREGNPGSVLDLGCGTGLPMLRLAGHCERYVALDVSRPTLDGLASAVRRAGLRQVELRQADAAQAETFAGAGFDLVACNSVSQYFSGPEYLLRTLRGALRAVRPGGRVILGDVLDLSVREAFHAAVVLAQADDGLPAQVVHARLRQRLADDPHLHVDPRWYAAALPGVDVQVRPRRGSLRNEMNDFRYDVVLTATATGADLRAGAGDGQPRRRPVDEWVEYGQLPEALRDGGRVVGVRAVPNARTAGAAALVQALRDGVAGTAGQLRAQVAAAEARAVHPETLHTLAAKFGYHCHVSRLAARSDGSFDVAFVPRDAGPSLPDFGPAPVAHRAPTLTTGLTTEPGRQHALTAARATVVPRLRDHAERHLPPHERPAAYVVLPRLPVTGHGKVDLSALPPPRSERPPVRSEYVPPADGTEREIARIWAGLLGIDRVGRDDDFTELGGDSLLAAQCARTVARTFAIELPPGALFTAPTVAAFTRLVERAAPSAAAGPVPADAADPATAVTADRNPAVTAAAASTVAPVAGGAGRDAAGGAGPEHRELPLASAQTIFWFLDHYRRPGAARHPDFALPVHYRITGRVDVEALTRAVDQLIARHPALRSRVLLGADEGRQEICPPPQRLLRHRTIVDADPRAALRQAAKADADPPLDLAAGRVFTADLTSAGETEHLLVIRVHHMVCDGWSLNLVERELGELYRAAVTGVAPRLDPPPDYAGLVGDADQTYFADVRWRDSDAGRAALTYWNGVAGGARPIHLTTPFPAPSSTTRLASVLLPAADAEAVVEAARTWHSTLFSALLAALARLLAADTGEEDVRLLTIAAARDAPGLDQVVGLLLNPLLLRMRADGDTGFGAQMSGAADRVRATLTHAQVPVLAICEEVPDLLTVMTESQFVAVESLPPVAGLDLPGCQIHRTDPFDPDFLGTTFALPVDLLLTARPEGRTIRICALYDPAAFDDGYLRRLLDRLRAALVAGAASPGTPLAVPPDPGPLGPDPKETR